MADERPDNVDAPSSPQTRTHRRLALERLVVLSIIVAIVAMLLPILNRWRAQNYARSTQRCASNLNRVGMAIAVYQVTHRVSVTPPLEALVAEGLDPSALVCPLTDDIPAHGSTPAEIAANVGGGGRLSYTYIGAGVVGNDADIVIAYDSTPNHGGGHHVLYADGHVDWLAPQPMRPILDEVAARRWPVRIRAASAARPATTKTSPSP